MGMNEPDISFAIRHVFVIFSLLGITLLMVDIIKFRRHLWRLYIPAISYFVFIIFFYAWRLSGVIKLPVVQINWLSSIIHFSGMAIICTLTAILSRCYGNHK